MNSRTSAFGLSSLLGPLGLLAAAAVALLLAVETAPNLPAADLPPGQTTFVNPILPKGADPFAFYYAGDFYLTATGDRELAVWKSPRLEEIGQGERQVVWRAPQTGPYSRHAWAPEIHQISGIFYLYFCADDGEDANHRIYVLQGTSDPMGPYTFKGKVADSSDQWAIDPTVFERGGAEYMVWSGWPHPPGPQKLYIAKMSNPWTISSKRIEIATPTRDWEKKGWPVNEGPEVLIHKNQIFIVFSASGGSTKNYCLGLLSNKTGRLLDATAWKKSPEPVFKLYEGADGSVFGPGHCSLLCSPDGREDWIVYHARDDAEEHWQGRSIRAQPFTWTAAGLPDFGHPIPPAVEIKSPSGE